MTQTKKLLTGKQIKKRREAHGLSQTVLGEEVGCKASYLSFIEGGYRPEDLTIIENITERLTRPVEPEVEKAVAEKKARAKARKTRARRAEVKKAGA